MNNVYERFLAFIFMQQLDRDMYGSLLKTLNTHHSLHNNQYPKTASKASKIFSNLKHHGEYNEKKKEVEER